MKKSFLKFLHVFLVVSMVVWSMAPGLGAFMNTANANVVGVTTNSASGITATDATLNGTNGIAPVDNYSFWVSTSTFSTASPTIPGGVYSTPVLPGPVGASVPLSASLSSITTTGVPSNLPAITPGTTYYFAAWINIGSNWYPGAVLNFTTAPAGPSISDCNASSFDGFTLGSVNGQDGWLVLNPLFDQEIVSNTYGYPAFGCQTLRISDSVTSGTFGDQIFSKPEVNGAGETSATAGAFSVGTLQNHFETQFDIASTLPTEQVGMHASVSPDRGDGSRMSYLRFEDKADGVHVFFDDVTDAGPLPTVANFNETDIATIDRTPHTIKLTMDFVDGPSNDVVKVYIDGVLKITGTSWEDYYRYDPEASAEQSPRIVKTVLFRESGTATPGDAGNGFLFDNFGSTSSVVPQIGNIEITKYDCPEGTVVNRTDNGVGGAQVPPAGCVPSSGKYFGYAHSTQIDAGAPYDDFNNPLTAGGVTDGSGILTISNLPADGRYIVFETDADNNKLADGDVLGLYCVGDADPNPNHNDNGDITFVPIDGTAQCVAYNKAPPASATVKVTIDKYINGVQATADNTQGTSFPMHAIYPGGEGDYALSSVGFNNPDAYKATTSDMPVGSDYSTYEIAPESCTVSYPYKLDGYSTGDTLSDAAGASVAATVPAFTNLTSDKFVIVWNKTCPPAPTLLTPADGTTLTTATWLTADWSDVVDWAMSMNYIYESANSLTTNLDGSFVAPVYTSSPLATSEIPTAGTPAGTYYWHAKAVDAASNSGPWATPFMATVDNTPPTATLTVVKHVENTYGGTAVASDFTMTVSPGGSFLGDEAGNQMTGLTPGEYTVSEDQLPGYSAVISGDCDSQTGVVTLAGGDNKTCTVTNTAAPGRLIIFKHTIGGDGSFDFTVNGPTEFTHAILTTNHSGTDNNGSMDAGTYSVAETVPSGWDFTSASCDNDDGATGELSDSTISNITIANGQTVTCTFTNTERGHIIVTKVTDPTGDQTAFSITAQTRDGSITDGGSRSISTVAPVDYEVTPGTYRVGEFAQTGWTQTGNTCLGLVVEAGATVGCTIINTKLPTLKLVKVVDNQYGGNGTSADWELSAINDQNGFSDLGNSDISHPITAGVYYALSETPVAGFDATGYTASTWSCNTGSFDLQTQSINLIPGENATCTITNNSTPGSITVIKHVINDNGGTKTASDFSLQVNIPQEVSSGNSILDTIFSFFGASNAYATVEQLFAPTPFSGNEDGTTIYFHNPTTYTVTEDSDSGYTTQMSGDCSGNIAMGQHVTCTITNDDIQPRIFNSGGGGGGGCAPGASFNFDLGKCVLNGGGQVLGASTGGQVLGAEKYHFTLFLKLGSHGNEVMELQTFLNAAGFGPLVVDGNFGPLTRAAVIKFQLANGLVGDGLVGPLTRAVLNK